MDEGKTKPGEKGVAVEEVENRGGKEIARGRGEVMEVPRVERVAEEKRVRDFSSEALEREGVGKVTTVYKGERVLISSSPGSENGGGGFSEGCGSRPYREG